MFVTLRRDAHAARVNTGIGNIINMYYYFTSKVNFVGEGVTKIRVTRSYAGVLRVGAMVIVGAGLFLLLADTRQ